MIRVCLLFIAVAAYGVTPVAVGSLLQHKANFFDLAHKRIRFTPRKSLNEYKLSVNSATRTFETGSLLDVKEAFDPKAKSWTVRLAFAFPFGGKTWTELHVNLNGNITFGSPETPQYPQRHSWPDGTMRSVAAWADTGTLNGRYMIAPLWAMYSADETRVHLKSSAKELIVTWDALRFQDINEGYDPLGRNRFQVRLTRDGTIEFAYGDVAERDGVVGVFPGPPKKGTTLDTGGVDDLGSFLRFRMQASTGAPRAVVFTESEGYVIALNLDDKTVEPSTFCFVLKDGRQDAPQDCPVSVSARTRDRTVEFYLPKLALAYANAFQWKLESAPNAATARMAQLRQPHRYGVDLSSGRGTFGGNIYEVFQYPSVTKSRFPAFKHIHRTHKGNAELGVILTDFRIDDIHNHGASNHVQQDSPLSSMELFGSDKLHSATGPVYIGPRFSEIRRDHTRDYRNYAFAVGWLAHELVHGWSAYVKWSPENPAALLDDTRGHWAELMHTPVFAPVAHLFTDRPYEEHSVMGGMAVVKNPDGTMSAAQSPSLVATGLSPFDLYLMGLAEPEEVPDTFVISRPTRQANGEYTGGENVRVRIADIIRYNGARKGPVARDVRLTIYLLHEDGRGPNAEKLAAARGMESMLIRYFDAGTKSRMKVVAVP